MKVGILTNLHPKCGNAEYARDIAQYLGKYCEVKLSDKVQDLLPADAVFINHHESRVPLRMEDLDRIRFAGGKSIVIIQNSHGDPFGSDIVLQSADAVMAHEPMQGDVEVHYIPVGIPIVENLAEPTEPRIGIAGFAFDWKRFDLTAEIARHYGVKCRIVSASPDISDTNKHLQALAGHLGPLAEMYPLWLSTEEVARLLSECTLNIFWYESKSPVDEMGQSGSVTLGIAAKRPMIISRHRKFKTLKPYEDEFYVADTEQQAWDFAKEVLSSPNTARRPHRIIEEMGWDKIAKQFLDLIERVTKQ